MGVFYKKENNLGVITFDLPDSKVNLLTGDVLKKLDAILDELVSQKDLDAVLLVSAKQGIYIAGADIKEIEGITEPAEGKAKAQAGQNVFNKLEDLPVPTIAVINGVALGGGCELVMSCTYRIATFSDKIKIGLPEVNLGIIPGFGGTYRMPRLVGLQKGLTMVLTGRPVSGKDALKMGLVDRLYPAECLDASVQDFISEIKGNVKRSKKFIRRPRGLVNKFLENTMPGQRLVLKMARKNVLKSTKGHYPAPLKAIDVIGQTISKGRSRGMTIEAESFSHLAVTNISKNLVQVFYLSERQKKVQASGENIQPKSIYRCGVLGAGIMGGGIAQILAYKDINVRMKDITHKALAQGFQSAAKVFQSGVKRRRITRSDASLKMHKITGTLDTSGFQKMDAVIEAVVEDMDIKKKVFQEICAVIPQEAMLCTNTSALSVTEMSTAATNPERVIGFHFFNPVHRMPLVEVITTDKTSSQTVATALGLVRRLNKTPILVKDAPGFLVNRILLGYMNEAGYILEEGADCEFIDKIMIDFGMPMGPFLLSDEVGLDVGLKVLKILEAGLGDRFKPVPLFEKVYEAKLLGKKSGNGFYLHGRRVPSFNPAVNKMRRPGLNDFTKRLEYRERMLFVMVNEAARCLADGVVADPADVDVGMIMGTGFPPFRGGLLRYADSLGIRHIYDALKSYEDLLQSSRFAPCEYLKELYQNKKGFYERSA